MASERAFLEAIIAEPDDDAVRLIFADWLEEQSNPSLNARGEFIRVQIERHTLPADDPRQAELAEREEALLARHRQGWEGPLRQLGAQEVTFRRGLPEAARMDVTAFLTHPGELFTLAPIRGLTLSMREIQDEAVRLERIQQLTQCPCLERLTSLNLVDNYIGDAGVTALAASPNLTHLISLDLSSNGIYAAGATALAASPTLAQITNLNLEYNWIGDAGAAALAESPFLNNLTTLDLWANEIGDAGIEALTAMLARRKAQGLPSLNITGIVIPPTAQLETPPQITRTAAQDRER
jgi:uncharacterized protein (TIGR02996 family)